MNKEGLEAYQVKKNLKKLEKKLEEEVGSEGESVWKKNRCGQIENRRNERWIAKEI